MCEPRDIGAAVLFFASPAARYVTNQIPEIELNGDEAHVVWAMQDRVIWGENRPSITGYGHYRERWVRRNGQWKIASLKLTRLHIDVHAQ